MKKVLSVSATVVFLGLVALYFATAPSDDEMIRQAIDESAKAAREGKPGNVLEHLSRSLTINGMPVADRGEISKYIRLASPEVKFGQYSPVVEEDSATVKTNVAVKFSFQGISMDETIPNVEVKLSREPGFRWVVFPATKWRIASVSAPEIPYFGE